ncbi:glycosyltransferase family 87 protein [Parenemella sanctibonifatiensis]|uniref:glycosyltransferase family 87 protein n=1 Tax=Parenemella sanctibonifatiensis TaxID=2016505 RepID=UPI0015C58671|nr:glycosyltransferase family 87 protein [Parenemella sanctibonifatiensis]
MTSTSGSSGSSTTAPSTPRTIVAWGFGAVLVLYAGLAQARIVPLLGEHPAGEDFAVYQRAGQAIWSGGDPYLTHEGFPFIYPPIAAWLFGPLALLSVPVGLALWSAVSALLTWWITWRAGVRRSLLSAGIAAVVLLAAAPFTRTVSLGQLGVLLTAAALLDFGRPAGRPGGWWRGIATGVASAVKLTPALFPVWALLSRQRRVAMVAILTAMALTLVGLIASPGLTWDFAMGLLRGETGIGDRANSISNQSVGAALRRLFGSSTAVSVLTVAVSLAAVVAALLAARRWHQAGRELFAVCLVGVATLVVSPVSWVHHHIWVLPLAVVLILEGRGIGPARWIGLAWAAWLAFFPPRLVPTDPEVWVYPWYLDLLGAVSVVLALALLVAALLSTPRIPSPASSSPAGTSPTSEPPAVG